MIVCLVSFKGIYGWHLLQKAQQSLISFRQNDLYFPSLCNESVFLVCLSSSVADSFCSHCSWNKTTLPPKAYSTLIPVISHSCLFFLLLLFLSLFIEHREQRSVSTLPPRHHSTCWAPLTLTSLCLSSVE